MQLLSSHVVLIHVVNVAEDLIQLLENISYAVSASEKWLTKVRSLA